MAKVLVQKLGSILPRILRVPLTDPFSYVQRELLSEVSTITRCLAFNSSPGDGSVVEKASGWCCNSFQLCLLSGNVLFYNPQPDELRHASPLSKEAFNIVAQNSALPVATLAQFGSLL